MNVQVYLSFIVHQSKEWFYLYYYSDDNSKMRGVIAFTSILLTGMLILPAFYQYSYSLVVANNPFYSMSNAKIQGVKGLTSDGKLLVELEYSPEVVKKDEFTFFRINFFDIDSNDRTRHVDCDLIVRKSGTELFKASKQYGEPLIHSPNGILLTSFGFNETGRYTLSVEVGGLNFFPIKPLFVDFFATTSKMSDGSFRSILSTQ
jgi:hypothetical protein